MQRLTARWNRWSRIPADVPDKEVESEELASLRETLYELGFSKRAIATAVKERMDA
jgi:hypothetical protein